MKQDSIALAEKVIQLYFKKIDKRKEIREQQREKEKQMLKDKKSKENRFHIISWLTIGIMLLLLLKWLQITMKG